MEYLTVPPTQQKTIENKSGNLKNVQCDIKHSYAKDETRHLVQTKTYDVVKEEAEVKVMTKSYDVMTKEQRVNVPTPRENFRKKTIWFVKKLVLFVFSQVGMVLLVVSYSIMGAFIFQALEAPKEMQNRVIINEIRDRTNKQLWDKTREFNILSEKNWTKAADVILQEFQLAIYEATKNLGWDGKSSEAEDVLEWTFEGALLFSVTVISTIGYGHVAPKTPWGRVVTIIYAFFGIPLTLICLANLGMFMGKGFRIIYCRCLTLTDSRRFQQLSFCSSLNSTQQSQKTSENHNVCEGKEVEIKEYKPKPDDVSQKPVPIVVCLILVLVYNLFGTILFDVWESNWDMLTSFYFCFITLSTIGFGDVVPGHSIKSWHSKSKQVICTLWLLFGLALLAMCFDLMQERIRGVARKIGTLAGLVKEKDHNQS